MKKLLIAGIVLGAVALGTTDSNAMAIYNKSSQTIHAYLRCGVFCNNTWKISPGDHKSRPNEGGELSVSNTSLFGGEANVNVDDHGWVKVYSEPDARCLRVESFHSNGSLHQRDYTCK